MNFDLAIDIGTKNLRMAVRDAGIVAEEPACVAYRAGREIPFAYGARARVMQGRALRVVYPVAESVPTDAALLSRWIARLVAKAELSRFRKLNILLSVSPLADEKQRQLLLSAALDAGASAAALVRSDLAAALGANLPITEACASLIVEMGAGAMTVSLISGGLIAASESTPHGMAELDDRIVRILRANGFSIGPNTAEELKMLLLAAKGVSGHISQDTVGVDAVSGFPRVRTINSHMLVGALEPTLTVLTEMCDRVVRCAPEELAADLTVTDILLTGGGANLFGMDALVTEKTGIGCRMAAEPDTAVIRGLLKMTQDPDKYAAVIGRAAEAVHS